jgi:hypothetical protein
MTNIIRNLERELPNNELLGRQLFLKLTKLFPQIEVDSSEDHENIDWSLYTFKIPKELIAMTSSPSSIDVEITDVDENSLYITVKLENQDYNSSTLPLDSKTVYDNIRNALTDKEKNEN